MLFTIGRSATDDGDLALVSGSGWMGQI